jgi:hypothetical protein
MFCEKLFKNTIIVAKKSGLKLILIKHLFILAKILGHREGIVIIYNNRTGIYGPVCGERWSKDEVNIF